MGAGFLEAVYEKCMLIELHNVGLKAEAQKSLKVYYKDILVGDYVADIIVEDLVVMELKAVREIAKAHESNWLILY